MIKTESNTRDSYKLYLTLTKTPQDVKKYILIANAYMKFIIGKIIEGDEVTLPARLGSLSIVGNKRKLKFDAEGKPMLPPDWGKTKKLWENNPAAKEAGKKVYCTNEETDGVVYKYHWSKNRVPIENKTLYALRMTRDNKRAVNRALKNKKEYYVKKI
jgi:hypothetical protein